MIPTGEKCRRALHITYSLDFGGVESRLRTFAHAPGHRYEHYFCALTKGGASAEAIRLTGAQVTILGADPWRAPVRVLFHLAKLIRRLRPSVVHTHGLEGNLFGILAALFSRIPVRIAEEIGIPDHSTKAKVALQMVYAMASRIVTVSEAVRQAIVDAGEAPARKIVRIYTPVELPPCKPVARLRGEVFQIGFVGRLEPEKNLLSLLRALTLLPDKSVELRIVGEGSERAAIEQFIRSNNLNREINLFGFKWKPSEIIANCHLYVQPSHSEGLSNSLVEAMGSGLPVIATTRGGMGEIVENGVNGWLIDSRGPQEIADAIEHAMQLEPSKLAEMGMAARRSVEDRFRPDRYVQEIEALYDECLPR
ncbi:MAG TPA: glycosyltransferase [Sphingomicrobium sp.]|nr:glycosyltransferase [Sphingomicrobium sp.]